jgi:hypothetical protein
MRRKSKAAVAVVEEPLATFTLTYQEPMSVWLAGDFAIRAESKALRVLAEHGIKLIEEFGGAGVGDWADGTHETGFVIEATASTASEVARLIEAETGYPVTLTDNHVEDGGFANDLALEALRARLNSGVEVDDSEIRPLKVAVFENAVSDLIQEYEARRRADEEEMYDRMMIAVLKGRLL